MNSIYCPFLYGKFRRFFKIAAMTVALTAAACAGSSDEPGEPVAAEEGSSEAKTNDEGSGLIIEQESPDETGNEVPQYADDTAMSDDVAAAEPAMSEDTDAVPEDIMTSAVDSAPESLDATLDSEPMASDEAVMNEAIAAQPVTDFGDQGASFEMDTAPAITNAGSFGQSSGVLPPGVIASPGAAIFIKSKYDESPASASGKSYVVTKGDSISGISKKLYGSFGHWKALASANGVKAPYIINPGNVLKYDPAPAKSGQTAGMKTIKVKHGDTLSKLAGELFGNIEAWKVLYELNKGKISNPDHIFAGMVLAYSGGKMTAAKKSKPNAAVPKKVMVPVEPVVEQATGEMEESDMPVAAATEEQEVTSALIDDESNTVINVDLPVSDEE